MAVGLTGTVITKADKSYNLARRDENLYYSYYPRAIVYPNNIIDVVNAVNWGRIQGLNIRCRSGGHNYEAFSVADDVLVIDVSNLLNFEIDTNQGFVTIGPGHNLDQLYNKVAKFGFAFVGGTCGTVGVSGITLGGGVGYLQRQYGLACDNLVEAQIVDSFGSIITANSYENQDLLAALFAKQVRVVTFKDVNVEELAKADLELPKGQGF